MESPQKGASTKKAHGTATAPQRDARDTTTEPGKDAGGTSTESAMGTHSTATEPSDDAHDATGTNVTGDARGTITEPPKDAYCDTATTSTSHIGRTPLTEYATLPIIDLTGDADDPEEDDEAFKGFAEDNDDTMMTE